MIRCASCGSDNRDSAHFCSNCGRLLAAPGRIGRLQPGQVIQGKYTIIRLLGRGGMGAVYLATQVIANNQRNVVIKEMLDYFDPANPESERKARERFESEAATLVALNFAYIPQIFDYFSEGGRNYIVMQYIPGRNLQERLTHEDESGQTIRGAPYSLDQVRRWGIQICKVLEYLAGQNVVHMDIKPANLIVNDAGDIWLVDFGTARAQQTVPPGGVMGMRRSSIYGTGGYAPPEQYQGYVESRSDVYALAATLYHLLTDDDPRHHPFQFPRLNTLPGPLAVSLMQALQHDVKQRSTAAQLRQALEGSASTRKSAMLSNSQASKADQHESYALITRQGLSDSARFTVIRLLQARRGLTALEAEVLTWKEPTCWAHGLDLASARALQQELRQIGVPVDLVLTSQLAGWRQGIVATDPRLIDNGEIIVRERDIPRDRLCHCYRCGYEWNTKAQSRTTLRSCPRCGSANWNKHRLCQCAVCGHQFTHGDLITPVAALFPSCPACRIPDWLPRQQPRLTKTSWTVDAGTVLAGKPIALPINLTLEGTTGVRGRIIADVSWLQVTHPTLVSDRFQVTVDATNLAAKQVHQGCLQVICNAGHATICVKVYVDQPPCLAVSAVALDFRKLSAQQKQTQTFVISNSGGQVLEGTITVAHPWVRLSSSVFKGERTEVWATIHGCDLPAAGVNQTVLTIHSNGGQATIAITAEGLPPTLAFQPITLEFGSQPRGYSVSRALDLSNQGTGSLQGQILVDQPWLTASPDRFNGSQERVLVSARTDGLDMGRAYTAKLTVVSNGGTADIPVHIEIAPHSWLEHVVHQLGGGWIALLIFSLILIPVLWHSLLHYGRPISGMISPGQGWVTPMRQTAPAVTVAVRQATAEARAAVTATSAAGEHAMAVATVTATALARAIVQAEDEPQTNVIDGADYLPVPAGEFLMGATSADSSADDDEKPQHVVYLDAFWIMKTEVTNAQYAQCVAAGACAEPGNTRWQDHEYIDHPVVNVGWSQAQTYCVWAGGRLPTEAEWEKAARGADGRRYPWGDAVPDVQRANYGNPNGGTTPVGSYPAGASPYGALDMAGNVWEWVADWYDAGYYARSPAVNPLGPDTGIGRVLRGGSWDYAAGGLRCSSRRYGPALRYSNIGFRCAR